jgi:hypothetical protein
VVRKKHVKKEVKTTCRKRRKRRKRSMQEQKKHGTQEDKPNQDRVSIFYKDCNGYNPIE